MTSHSVRRVRRPSSLLRAGIGAGQCSRPDLVGGRAAQWARRQAGRTGAVGCAGARAEPTAVAPAERVPTDMPPTEALFDAINRGDLTGAKDAIGRGADIHGHNVLGLTPLELSVDLGRNTISFLLLSLRGGAGYGAGGAPRATAATTPAVRPSAGPRAAPRIRRVVSRPQPNARRRGRVRRPRRRSRGPRACSPAMAAHRCRRQASSGSILPDSLPAAAAEAAASLPKDTRPRPPGSARDYWKLAGGYWRGRTARTAWKLTIASVLLVMANTAVQYGVNKWNAFFFDALQQKSQRGVMGAVALFAVLAVAASLISVFALVSRMKLQVFWRQWLTERLTVRWLDNQRFYRLSIAAPDLDAPEFRIAEDARVATEPVVEFGTGIMNAVLAAVVFFGVLWTVGGDIEVFGVTIPGFMVIAAAAYSGAMSGSMLIFGRPLITRIEEKNAAEARLRTEMGRVRENAESIALIGGEADETKALHETLHLLVEAWMRMLRQWSRMMWMMGSNWAVAPVVPLLLEAPNFLAGKMTLGALMQTAAAFAQVQVALNWIFDNYPRIAEWMASAGRVTGLWAAFLQLDKSVGTETHEHIVIGESPDEAVRLENLSVAQFNGRVMIDEASTAIERGDRVLLTGESGTGKSTLIRAIAGLWPWGSGRVLIPHGARVAFLPQRAYIPNGTLRQVLHYPITAREPSTEELAEALTRCGLQHLIPRLDEEDRWDKLLSGGEQQRIGFVRLLVQKPDVVIMDEATAALDIASQASIMGLFGQELSGATLISVGHRPELEQFHTRKLTLRRFGADEGAEREGERRQRLAKILRRTLRPRPTPDASRPPTSPRSL